MGRTALEKLRSRKGASLTFALLAFLVCAVISAVLLASASAATGRLSNLAETDQRYYAVTSAAQLFCDTLEGQEFTIERTHTNYQVKFRKYITVDGIMSGYSFSFDNDDEIRYWFGESVRKKYNQQNIFTFKAIGSEGTNLNCSDEYLTLSDEELKTDNTPDLIYSIRSNSLLANAALTYVLGVPTENSDHTVNKCSAEEAFGKTPGQSFVVTGSTELKDEKELGTFKLEFSGDRPEGVEYPNITAVAKLRKDGSIVIEFSNVPESETDNKTYTVTVTLSAEVTDNSGLPLTISSDSTAFRFDPQSAFYYENTVTAKEQMKTTTIKWHVTDIKKGAA